MGSCLPQIEWAPQFERPGSEGRLHPRSLLTNAFGKARVRSNLWPAQPSSSVRERALRSLQTSRLRQGQARVMSKVTSPNVEKHAEVLPEHVSALDLGPSDEGSNLLAASGKKRLIGVEVKDPVAPRGSEEEVAYCREVVSPRKLQHPCPVTPCHFTRVVVGPGVDNDDLIDEALERLDRFPDVCGFVSHQQAEAERVFHAPEYITARRGEPRKVGRRRDQGRQRKCDPALMAAEIRTKRAQQAEKSLRGRRSRILRPSMSACRGAGKGAFAPISAVTEGRVHRRR